MRFHHHFICILSLLFITQSVFSADFLDEIREQYSALFPKAVKKEEVPYQYSFCRVPKYTGELLSKLPQYGKKPSSDLFPNGMLTPSELLKSTHFVFGVDSVDGYADSYRSDSEKEAKRKSAEEIEERFREAHLDMIRAYWQGYIAFLEELNGAEGKWDAFSQEFGTAFEVPIFDNSWNYNRATVKYNSSSSDKLSETNKQDFLPVFFAHYCLGTFFQESKNVPPSLRVKALLWLKKSDPEMKFLSAKKPSNQYGAVDFSTKRTNLLPETFHEGLIEDQEVDDRQFYENPKVLENFGRKGRGWGTENQWTQETFQRGLNTLLLNHKQEMIQILHSLLKLDSNNPSIYGIMTMRYLIKVAESQDMEFLGLALGEHASFRNKGRITLVLDDLPLLSKDVLVETARAQKKRLQDLSSCLEKAEADFNLKSKRIKEDLTSNRTQCLLGSLDERVDPKGWLKSFHVNPFLTFEENQETIKFFYRRESVKIHPDKHSQASDDEQAALGHQMSELTEGYQTLTSRQSYERYFGDCRLRAFALAENYVTGVYGNN